LNDGVISDLLTIASYELRKALKVGSLFDWSAHVNFNKDHTYFMY